MNKDSIWWYAPEYFSRWRLFPRAFISMYIYLLYKTVIWFQDLPAPTMEQAGLVSVVVGAGAAWFGLYVNSTSSQHAPVSVPQQTGSMPTSSSSPAPVQQVQASAPATAPADADDDGLPPPVRRRA